ncbi:ASCH domain-containing protein [Pediococcus argentinicus]|uniref:ASCH domain-containing protein n=1 Tax=Pediococcus argentinicus TaxID=480391 RepID=A0A0R2NJJ6_9LACO|nr:ASCH domain-containing protein [Pediococcus argentinicus]KRO25516.1 hypothetical protein IV88_GL001766 [Pediococcus argentinicus]NKZ22208.1 ASCH domain-containing protein [Pediococcus argentinicus]GEP19259.1 RNA-binding protein [Pediococcus argentinicus]
MATPSETLWNKFIEKNHITGKTFQTRWFGEQDNPEQINRINEQLLTGQRNSTSKPLAYYASEQEAVPQVGDYYVLLNGDMKPVAVIETVVSELIPFLRVSAEHAYNEVDSDQTLESWRTNSKENFEKLMQKYDAHFNEENPIVCEVVKVVYRPED